MLSRRSSCSPCRSLLSQDCCRNRARRATSRASTGWGSGRRSGSGGGGARGWRAGPEGGWGCQEAGLEGGWRGSRQAGAVLAAAAHGHVQGLLALLGRLSGVLEQQAEAVQPLRDPELRSQARVAYCGGRLRSSRGRGRPYPLPCLCPGQQPTGRRSWHARPRFPHPSSASDNQSLPGLRVHQREPPPGSEPQGCVWGAHH